MEDALLRIPSDQAFNRTIVELKRDLAELRERIEAGF